MKKQLTRIAPLQAGIVLGALYGVLAGIFAILAIPVILLGAMFSHQEAGSAAIGTVGSIIIAILVPIVYAVFGFIGGVIAAAIYNLIAKLTGGIEFEVRNLPSSVSSS